MQLLLSLEGMQGPYTEGIDAYGTVKAALNSMKCSDPNVWMTSVLAELTNSLVRTKVQSFTMPNGLQDFISFQLGRKEVYKRQLLKAIIAIYDAQAYQRQERETYGK